MMKVKTKSIFYGFLAAFLVFFVNLVVLFVLNFPPMAMKIIGKYWYLIIFLIVGFGVQVGLFVFHKSALACSTTVASGSISSISMILCCSHYLLNILPILGALVGASFLASLADYTVYFLILGAISNIVGILIMNFQIKKKGGFMK